MNSQAIASIALGLALSGQGVRGDSQLEAIGPGPRSRAIFYVRRLTSDAGLPANRVSALAQTGDGYLWIGTWFGLVRFDGIRSVIFDDINTPKLSTSAITALAVDRVDGTLWIGTANGLVGFKDGRFERLADSDRLANWDISKLTASAGGGVWVRAGNKVAHWRQGASHPVKLDFAANESSGDIFEVADGLAHVQTYSRVFHVTADGRATEHALPPGGPHPPWTPSLLPWDSTGRMWLGASDRLISCKEGKWRDEQLFVPRGLSEDHFLEDRAGGVWTAVGHVGLWRHGDGGSKSVSLDDRGSEKSVTCLLEDREGSVWVGTSQGLFQIRPRFIHTVSIEEGMPDRECWSVAEAPDGTVWVETRKGLARIDGDAVETFANEPLRQHRCSVLVDGEGFVWMGDSHQDILSWRPEGPTNSFRAKGDSSNSLTLDSLFLDRTGRVWVGTDDGVTWVENNQLATAWGECGLPTNRVTAVYQTRDGAMWFGTWRAGVVQWNDNSVVEAPSPDIAGDPTPSVGNSQPSARSDSSLVPPDPRTPAHLARPSSSVKRITTRDGLADDRILFFHEDADGALWIGTHNGLNRLKDGRIFTFRTEQGLPDNLINWLEEDDFGRMWFSCNRGIFRIDRSEMNAAADGHKARVAAATYGTTDGMLTPETNGEHQPAGCKTHDGRLWFPTADGVTVIDPRTLKDEGRLPPVVIEDIYADGERVYGNLEEPTTPKPGVASSSRGDRDAGESRIGGGSPHATSRSTAMPPIALAPGRGRVLRIRYTANSFAASKRVQFRFRLVGLDLDWREETGERVAYYTDLHPGQYRFEVKAANHHGVWNEVPAALSFLVAPHYWQTWPFRGLCAAGVIGGAGLLLAYRLRVQRRILRLEQTYALQHERARIADDLHDDLGANLTGLALKADLARRQRQSDTLDAHLESVASTARSLTDSLREIVWLANPRHDSLESLAIFLAALAEKIAKAGGVRCRLDLPEKIPALSVTSLARHHVCLAVKEALHNSLKHASAQEVHFHFAVHAEDVRIVIADDGKGFERGDAGLTGNGLQTMRRRVECELGGVWLLDSRRPGGTRIEMRLPRASLAQRASS